MSKLVHATPNSKHLDSLWQFKPIPTSQYGNNRYMLQTKKYVNNSCLDIVNGGDNDQKLHLKHCGNFSGQNFSLVPVGTHKYNLMPLWQKNLWSASTRYFSCLSLTDAKPTNIVLEKCDGSKNQIFTIKPSPSA